MLRNVVSFRYTFEVPVFEFSDPLVKLIFILSRSLKLVFYDEDQPKPRKNEKQKALRM